MIFLYVGPGMGGGLLAAVLGILLSIVGGLIAVVWFPLKRLFKNRGKATDET